MANSVSSADSRTSEGTTTMGHAQPSVVVDRRLLLKHLNSAEFHQHYDLVMDKGGGGPTVVGSGAFGSILLCAQKRQGRMRDSTCSPIECVAKVLTTSSSEEGSSSANHQCRTGDPSPSKDELAVLRHLGVHPNLLPLLDCYPITVVPTISTLQQQYALVFPWMNGGDLFDEIGAHGAYPEQDAKVLLWGLLQGLHHMHQSGIAHRDVKPENILLATPGGGIESPPGQYRRRRPTQAVLADFGLAGAVPAKDCCGSPLYAAPELLVAAKHHVPYTTKVDLYSLGVVAYAVLTGGVPFTGSPEELFRHTLHTPAPFKSRCGWSSVSSQGIDLVHQLLGKDPILRPSAQDALHHAWFVGTEGAQQYLADQQRIASVGSLQAPHTHPPPPPPVSTKARTASPDLLRDSRPNCDSTSDRTRSWYNKSQVQESISGVDSQRRTLQGKQPGTIPTGTSATRDHQAADLPLHFPKMGSVTGLRLLYGGGCGGGDGDGDGLNVTPHCPSSFGAGNLVSHQCSDDDTLLVRQNSNSAPTLFLSSASMSSAVLQLNPVQFPLGGSEG